jgi:alkylhydroperoxidase/carboxymuconolactone decarboxylase family protein YurZ
VQDGLDVSRPDVTTEEEIAAYRAEYLGTNKGLLDSFEFWLEFRPDVLKRHKARTRHFRSTLEPDRPLVGILGAIHQYTVAAFREGVAYEIRLAQSLGATRTDILDTLSVAFIHAGHPGMYAAAAYADFLRAYDDPEPAAERFPDGWSFDPGAFDSGIDYSRREASAEDMERLVDWYERTVGEVPGHVRFLVAHRPGLLKAYRDRYEHAIRDSLPKQMLPYLLLGHNVVRGFHDGIRENVLLGRALGMTREQLLDAICHSVLHAGVEALAIVQDAAGDLLDERWPEVAAS